MNFKPFFISLLLLTACGFQPMYGTVGAQGSAAESLKAVEIASIPNRQGQELRNLLIDRMHRDGATPSKYRLDVGLRATETELGIRKDDTATRARLRMDADYTLTDKKTGQVVYRDKSRTFVGYNILTSEYGTLVNEKDAYKRAVKDLSEDIVNRLSIYLSKDKPAHDPIE